MPSFAFMGNRLLLNSTNSIQTSDVTGCVSWRVITCSLLLLFGSSAQAQEMPAHAQQASELSETAAQKSYRDSTDAELTNLVKKWAFLSATERRLLLSEIRSRMKSARTSEAAVGSQPVDKTGAKNPTALDRVMAQQSYGRTLRRSDGSLVTETETIKVTPRGRQVTRQTTITPAISGSSKVNGASNKRVGEGGVVVTEVLAPRRVMRTKIRFGAGFERRQSDAAGAASGAELQEKKSARVSSSEPSQH